MSGPVTPPLEVTEVDGSPDGRPITKLVVSNGSLSISGRTATITTSGGGSGTVTSITAAADSGSGTAITTTGTFTFTGSTGITTSVSGTTVTLTADNNGTVTSITPAADSGSGTAITSSGTLTFTGGTRVTTSVSGTTVTIDNDAIEGTAVLSTGETAATKFLREDGDGTSSWQAATATVPDPLLLDAGSAAAPTYSFSADDDTGLYDVGGNILGFASGGTKRAEISVSGMVLGSGAAAGKVTTKGAYNLEITTNEDSNSGTITIQQGTNQDILIEPDGTGLVTFYSGANAWTIENGQGSNTQVLTTDGAGAATWEDAGGGGGTAGASQIIGLPYGYNDGTDMQMLNRSSWSGTTKTESTSQSTSGCIMFPFIAAKSGDFDTATIYFSATGGTTTGTLDMGIYSDSAGVPNAKIGDASFDPTSASIQTVSMSASTTVVVGTMYWAVFVKNGTDANPAIYTNKQDYDTPLGSAGNVFSNGSPCLHSSADTTLPASFTSTDLVYLSTPRVSVGVKYT